jgi:translation elongation factor EF-Ts
MATAPNNARLVKQLRDMTGSPLKDCLKALDESKGDIEVAKELLRKRGLADAEKRTGRSTGEGYVGMKFDKENRLVTFVEMTCETDFVAKTDKFIQGVEAVVDTLHSHGQTLHVGQEQMADADLISKLIKEIKLLKSLDADVPT